MNANTPFPAPRPAISAAERARREKAVSFARGSVRYEGGIPVSYTHLRAHET